MIDANERWTRQFAEEGYFVVERGVAGPLLDGLQRDADCAVAEERGRLARDDRQDTFLVAPDLQDEELQTWMRKDENVREKGGEERYVSVSQLDDRYVISGFVRRSQFVRELVFGEVMASICRATLGDDAFLYSETFVCKAPHNEAGWVWHQDSSYLDYVGCGHYPSNLSVWVALDDMTDESGTLRVLPFSVLDVRQTVPPGFTRPWTNDDVVELGRRDGTLLTIPAGSLVVLDGALPHASDTNRTDRPRRAYVVQYSRQPVLKDDKPVQLAVPFVQRGVHRMPTLNEIQR